MKNVFLISLLFWTTGFTTYGQLPQSFSFQGVAFDPSGNPMENATIAIRAAIILGGNEVYSEVHHAQTGIKGLYSLAIGAGNVESGNFTSIDWSRGNAFLSVSIDLQNGNNFVPIGITQLLSVPYALYANDARIKPRIMVSHAPIYEPITLFKNKEHSTSAFDYNYNWVHGEPEDVYVEYKGLPPNIGLKKMTLNGFGLNDPLIIEGNVDTIYDGFIRGAVFFLVIDKTIDITAGSYPITANFRNKDMIFDSLHLALNVYSSYLQNCIKQDLKTYSIQSNNCPEIDTFIANAVTLTYRDDESRFITNILDSTKLDYFEVLDLLCNMSYYHNSTIPGYTTYGFNISFDENQCYFNFNLKPMGAGMQKNCKLVYKAE